MKTKCDMPSDGKKLKKVIEETLSKHNLLLWIKYQEIWSKEYRTKKFWFAEDAKNLVDYIRKHPKYFRIVSCGGFEDEDEMRYVLGW